MNYNFSHFSLAERESEKFADKLLTKTVTNIDIWFGGNNYKIVCNLLTIYRTVFKKGYNRNLHCIAIDGWSVLHNISMTISKLQSRLHIGVTQGFILRFCCVCILGNNEHYLLLFLIQFFPLGKILFYLLINLLDEEELEECIEVYKGVNPE